MQQIVRNLHTNSHSSCLLGGESLLKGFYNDTYEDRTRSVEEVLMSSE